MLILLASYPRSGNTLLRTILFRSFGIETFSIYDDTTDIGRDPATAAAVGHVSHGLSPSDFLEWAHRTDELVCAKTHELPTDDTPAIYVVRDGRASIVSYWHYQRDFADQPRSLLEVIEGQVFAGSWSKHVQAWTQHARPNALVLRYEELVRGDRGTLRQIADFIQKPVLAPFNVSFDELKSINSKFFRAGQDQDAASTFGTSEREQFDRLHGETMRELGYPVEWPSSDVGAAAPQSAKSGQRHSVFWLASYPRSGNTYLRLALHFLLFGDDTRNLDESIAEFVITSPSSLLHALSEGKKTPTHWVKTHAPIPLYDDTRISTVGAAYIYRHPLDVFLSCINYAYINSSLPAFREYFLNQEPLSVDEIQARGQLAHYFQQFLEHDGVAPFEPYSGRWSENLENWAQLHWHSPETHLFISYTELTGDTESVLARILKACQLEYPVEEIAAAVAKARAATRPNGGFYWKGRAGAFRDYLTREQIEHYFERYEDRWTRFGIAFQR